MSVVDQLDAAFRLYRGHFATFLGIVAVLQVPLLVVQMLHDYLYVLPLGQVLEAQAQLGEPDLALLADALRPVALGYVALAAAGVLLDTLIGGALAYAVSRAFLGQPTDILGAYDYLAHGPRLLNLLGAGLAVSLVTGAAGALPVLAAALATLSAPWLLCLLCLLAPAAAVLLVYLNLRFLLVAQAVVLEDRGALQAIGRAWRLMSGHLRRAFGLVVLASLVTTVIPLGLRYLVLFALSSLPLPPVTSSFVQGGLSGLLQIAVLPVLLSAYTLFYYDLRLRKEDFDWRAHAQRLTTLGV